MVPIREINFEEQVSKILLPFILWMSYLERITCQGLEVEFRKFFSLRHQLEHFQQNPANPQQSMVHICCWWHIAIIQWTSEFGSRFILKTWIPPIWTQITKIRQRMSSFGNLTYENLPLLTYAIILLHCFCWYLMQILFPFCMWFLLPLVVWQII